MTTQKTSKVYTQSYSWRAPLSEHSNFCDCCGSSFVGVDAWSLNSYYNASGAAGKGIIMDFKPPTKELKADEKTTEVVTRNGTLFFTTRHPS